MNECKPLDGGGGGRGGDTRGGGARGGGGGGGGGGNRRVDFELPIRGEGGGGGGGGGAPTLIALCTSEPAHTRRFLLFLLLLLLLLLPLPDAFPARCLLRGTPAFLAPVSFPLELSAPPWPPLQVRSTLAASSTRSLTD